MVFDSPTIPKIKEEVNKEVKYSTNFKVIAFKCTNLRIMIIFK